MYSLGLFIPCGFVLCRSIGGILTSKVMLCPWTSGSKIGIDWIFLTSFSRSQLSTAYMMADLTFRVSFFHTTSKWKALVLLPVGLRFARPFWNIHSIRVLGASCPKGVACGSKYSQIIPCIVNWPGMNIPLAVRFVSKTTASYCSTLNFSHQIPIIYFTSESFFATASCSHVYPV